VISVRAGACRRAAGPTSRSPAPLRARRRFAPPAIACLIVTVAGLAASSLATTPAGAAVRTSAPTAPPSAAPPARPGTSLESAAAKAGDTGRAVAMSLIGLGFAVAAIVLAFRRDFKEAAGVFAVGIVAVLLATPAGINLLKDTVSSLFGS
jgi:hypothetical protein